ncbi:MAG TPA: Rieske 2Fe-2S domain-containing protein [Candidatus Limnocylindria bacterium]|nr:Rieske 2Fe-2S domain-containing protein [Candidatus Limnocylindria bacterium]
MIRTRSAAPPTRRAVLRAGLFGLAALATAEVAAAVAPFLRVNKIVGLGEVVATGLTPADALARFAATNDAPILYAQHRFFLLHAPGGIVAAYRKCTHLGCAVPFDPAKDQFNCPCHGSIYDKRTAVVIRDPAPRPLDLFHVSEREGKLFVDTNPLTAIVRAENRWDPAVVEVRD